MTIKRMASRKLFFAMALFIFLTSISFVSCKQETETDGKIPFSPLDGSYTLYLESGWAMFDTDIPNQLVLSERSGLGFILTVECYNKENLASQDIPDLDAYIETYNTTDTAIGIYEGHQADTMQSFNEKTILNGKRQKVYIPIPEKPEDMSEEEFNNLYPEDRTSEVIHLDTKNFYFTLTYGNFNSKFEESQAQINDAIKTLEINYQE